MFHCLNQAFRIVAYLIVFRTQTLPDVGNSVKDDSSHHITRVFPIVWCPGFMVVTPSFTRLSITFSNQRINNCSPSVDVGFVKLMSGSFYGNRAFKINIQLCCHLCCIIRWLIETVLLNVLWSLSVNIDFRPLFLFADVVFAWFVYADITLEIVALDTPNNMEVLS
jgi:hypothetical protein